MSSRLLSGGLVVAHLFGGHHQLSGQEDGVMDFSQLESWRKCEALQM